LTLVTLVTAAAMVSTIKYDNLPRPTPGAIRQRPWIFLVFLAGVTASIATGGRAIFPFMMLYMIGGAIRHGISVLIRKRGEEEDDDSMEEPDPDPFSM
jgi:uncharacterized membrane protein YfcA